VVNSSEWCAGELGRHNMVSECFLRGFACGIGVASAILVLVGLWLGRFGPFR
jgi:hypothetical protein